jgi:hypothetical protein
MFHRALQYRAFALFRVSLTYLDGLTWLLAKLVHARWQNLIKTLWEYVAFTTTIFF